MTTKRTDQPIPSATTRVRSAAAEPTAASGRAARRSSPDCKISVPMSTPAGWTPRQPVAFLVAGCKCRGWARPRIATLSGGTRVSPLVLGTGGIAGPKDCYIYRGGIEPFGSAENPKTLGAAEPVSQAEQTDVSRYYDLLHLWTRLNKGFRAFSGIEARAIHRWLDHPDSGDFSPATIHAIMLAGGLADTPIAALDAGCGYGGTMFALQAALGGCWHGITISPRQCAVGAKAARQKGLGDAVTFACASYDAADARLQSDLRHREPGPQHRPGPDGRQSGGRAAPGRYLHHRRRHAGRSGAGGIRRRPGGLQGSVALPRDAVRDPMVGASRRRAMRRRRHPRPQRPDAAALRARGVAGDRRGPPAPPLARSARPAADRRSGDRRPAAGAARPRARRALHDDPGAQAAVVQFSASLPAILLRHCPRKRAIQYARDSIRILFPSISTACVYWIARFRGQ